MFPSVTKNKLYIHCMDITPAIEFPISTVEKSVMLATLCSKPVVINDKIHQTIIINFPDSLFSLYVLQIVKHTNMLHKMPRARSSIGDSATFNLVAWVIIS